MNNISPRETFDSKMDQLQDQLLMLGSMVEQATLDAVDALKRSRSWKLPNRSMLMTRKLIKSVLRLKTLAFP